METAEGIGYSVRTPSDYDPTVAWPLVMVYAGAGGDAASMEIATGLTPYATEAGFVIAYADHRSPTSETVIEELARIPEEAAATWCIDPARVYLTGHSDGGSISSVIAIWEMLSPVPAAIAPSAAGVDRDWVEASGCPAPMPVMVMHSSGDTLFPLSEGFGAEVADWWAECNGCDPTPEEPTDDGCVSYPGCSDGTEVLYCEGTKGHGSWPKLDDSIIGFFGRHPSP